MLAVFWGPFRVKIGHTPLYLYLILPSQIPGSPLTLPSSLCLALGTFPVPLQGPPNSAQDVVVGGTGTDLRAPRCSQQVTAPCQETSSSGPAPGSVPGGRDPGAPARGQITSPPPVQARPGRFSLAERCRKDRHPGVAGPGCRAPQRAPRGASSSPLPRQRVSSR